MVHSTNYTATDTGISGISPTGKLKWLPYRPTVPRDDEVVATRHVARTRSTSRVRTAQLKQTDPFDDPFGDSDATTKPYKPVLIDDVLKKLESDSPTNVPLDSLPGDSDDDKLPPLDDRPDVQPDTGLPPDTFIPGIKDDTLEGSLAKGRVDLIDKCPSPDDIKPIDELTINIKAEDGDVPKECSLGEKTFEPRVWAPTRFMWKASGLCHKPLYFEDVHLERYGHSWGPFLQPVISGGHFFLTVPVLPYKMGLTPPRECMYTLGYYRPGSCAPYMLDPLPLSIRAALFEGGAWVGAAAAIP